MRACHVASVFISASLNHMQQIAATVPGGVWDNMMRAGIVGNPLYRDNAVTYASVTAASTSFVFTKNFDLPPEFLVGASDAGEPPGTWKPCCHGHHVRRGALVAKNYFSQPPQSAFLIHTSDSAVDVLFCHALLASVSRAHDACVRSHHSS